MLHNSDFYREGSDACRNYSRLTMQVRTLSQNVLIAYLVGLGIAYRTLSTDGESGFAHILWTTGFVLVLFSISLAVVNWHYQSAFEAIRDNLKRLEENANLVGPWRVHQLVRGGRKDAYAQFAPFVISAFIGVSEIFIAAVIWFGQESYGWGFFMVAVAVVAIGTTFFSLRWISKTQTEDLLAVRNLLDEQMPN